MKPIIILKTVIMAVLFCFILISPSLAEESPYFFIAIHNESCPPELPSELCTIRQSKAFDRLKGLANQPPFREGSIKLTIMLSGDLGKWIVDHGQENTILDWKERGHEIAAHHHSIYHNSWDKYSDYENEQIGTIRYRLGCDEVPERVGNLNDFVALFEGMGGVDSGAFNDDVDKKVLPSGVISVDTGLGYPNLYEQRETRMRDNQVEKGVNQFYQYGVVKDHKRIWLGHYLGDKFLGDLMSLQQTISDMSPEQVYGIAFHNSKLGFDSLDSFIKMMINKDYLLKSKSVTMSDSVEFLTGEKVTGEMLRPYTLDAGCRPDVDSL